MLLKAAITGNLRQHMQAEVRKVAGGLRRAVTAAAQDTQAELRGQSRNTGFKDGGRSLSNAWRLRVFPDPGRAPDTLRPAGLVWSRMPDIAEANDKGAVIRSKKGSYLAFPTGYNAALGLRNAGKRGGLRVTPDQMQQAGKRGEAFVIQSDNPRVKLWCLRVAGAYGVTKRTRNRLRLFVGANTEVVTGKVKGLQQKRRDVLKQGFVPMFFLMRQVTLRKRLDIAGVRARASIRFARAAAAELSRLAQ